MGLRGAKNEALLDRVCGTDTDIPCRESGTSAAVLMFADRAGVESLCGYHGVLTDVLDQPQ